MARVAVQLTNFTGGELSPRLDGRNDLAKYASGCKTLQNMVVYPHGAAARRPGTNFVAEVKTSSAFTRLIPFQFSTEQTYILEFGNQYIRFYKDSGAILEANKTITNITQANPGVVTASFTTSSFPVVESTALYNSAGSAVTTAPVTMPTDIVSGNLLIMLFKTGSVTVTTPTGWTLLSSRISTGRTFIYYKISNGTEGSVVNVTQGSAHVSAITYRISNYEGTPEALFESTNVNDPPSLTTSWASQKNLFIAACTTRRSDNDFTVAPTGYSDLLTTGNTSSAATTHTRAATATKQVDGQTDNPSAFTTTGTLDNPHSATIAIRGAITSLSNGDNVVISGVVGMTQVNGKRFKVANKTDTTFQLQDIDGNNVNTTSYTAYTSGGVFNRVYTLTTSYLTADLETLKFAQSADVMYIVHPNYPVQKLSRTGHTSWTLEEIEFVNGPFLDHNIEVTKLTASAATGDGITITASDIVGINNDQGFLSTDVGRLVHIGIGKGVAKIVSITSSLVVVADVIEPISTKTPTETAKFLNDSDTTIDVDDTAPFPSTGTILIEDEQITYTGKTSTSPFQFTGCTRGANSTIATTHEKDEEVVSLNVDPTDDWALGAFSETTGYPSCVTFYEQRLVFAGTKDQPQTLYFSKSGDYENMDDNYHGTIADDDAIVYTIASDQVNAIRFLSATRLLIVGTVGGEFSVSGGGGDDPVTPTNILIKKQSNNGCANVDPIPVGNVTLFLQRAKRKIRELAYNFDVDGYVAPDLTILAEHISETGFNELSYQQEPNQIIWAVREDGQLAGLTYQREQQVVAWHRHIFGGAFSTGNAVCESVATIPTDDKEYQTWVIVKRTINGVTRRYVEYLNEFDFNEDDNTDFNFLDSQLAYSGSATVTITGLDHLEGQVVSVLANGSTHPNRTVTNGSITLARSSTKVKVGLPYTSILQTMRIDAGSQNGTSQAKTKRIYNITVRLYESIGVEVGPDLNNMESIPFRSSAQLMDTAIPVYTGDKEVEFRGNYETDGYIYVRQTQPLPLTVLSLYPELITND